MAHVGMKYPVAAPMKEIKDGVPIYGKGFVIGKAISFTGTPNKNDVTLYADDGMAESDKTQRDWGVSLNTDDIDLKTQAELLGHDYEEPSGGEDESDPGYKPERIIIGTDDIAPYYGSGFYKRRRKNGVTSFTAIWLYKTQYSEPTENAETKGDTINFQTPTIEGSAYPVDIKGTDGVIKMTIGEKVIFKSEAAAKKWLDDKIAGSGE